MSKRKWTVVDGHNLKPGDKIPVLGRFHTEAEAVEFVGTLPDHETGRYGIDGPEEQ